MKNIKKKLDIFLKKNLPKYEKEYGITDVSVRGVKYPSKGIGFVFVDTEPDANVLRNRKSLTFYVILTEKLTEDVMTALSLVGENPYDYLYRFNEIPLWKLDEPELPFDEKIQENKRIRIFSEKVDNEELKWHFDDEDRKVRVLHKTNWMLQMDDELPKPIIEGKIYNIPKGVYHRVIKGDGDLTVEIEIL